MASPVAVSVRGWFRPAAVGECAREFSPAAGAGHRRLSAQLLRGDGVAQELRLGVATPCSRAGSDVLSALAEVRPSWRTPTASTRHRDDAGACHACCAAVAVREKMAPLITPSPMAAPSTCTTRCEVISAPASSNAYAMSLKLPTTSAEKMPPRANTPAQPSNAAQRSSLPLKVQTVFGRAGGLEEQRPDEHERHVQRQQPVTVSLEPGQGRSPCLRGTCRFTS